VVCQHVAQQVLTSISDCGQSAAVFNIVGHEALLVTCIKQRSIIILIAAKSTHLQSVISLINIRGSVWFNLYQTIGLMFSNPPIRSQHMPLYWLIDWLIDCCENPDKRPIFGKPSRHLIRLLKKMLDYWGVNLCVMIYKRLQCTTNALVRHARSLQCMGAVTLNLTIHRTVGRTDYYRTLSGRLKG